MNAICFIARPITRHLHHNVIRRMMNRLALALADSPRTRSSSLLSKGRKGKQVVERGTSKCEKRKCNEAGCTEGVTLGRMLSEQMMDYDGARRRCGSQIPSASFRSERRMWVAGEWCCSDDNAVVPLVLFRPGEERSAGGILEDLPDALA